MTRTLLVPLFILIYYMPQATALPAGIGITSRAYHARSSSNGPDRNPKVIIIAVLAAVLSIFAFFLVRGYLKRRKVGNEGSRGDLGRRATINYTSIVEQAHNFRTETREAGTAVNNASIGHARQARVNRRPSQNSSRSLPAYKERLPYGEIVLVERTERPSMSENYENHIDIGEQTEDTPLTGTATSQAYTVTDLTPPYVPCRPKNPDSPTGSSTNCVEYWQGRQENQGSSRDNSVSPVGVTELEHTGTRVPSVSRPGDTASRTITLP